MDEKTNMQVNSTGTEHLDAHTAEALPEIISKAEYILSRRFQYDLSQYQALPPVMDNMRAEISARSRFYRITGIAYDKQGDIRAKLVNVYNALFAVNGSVVLLIDSNGSSVDLYLGTKTENANDIHIAHKTLETAIRGNFPGCTCTNMVKRKIASMIDGAFRYRDCSTIENSRTITAVSGVPGLRKSLGVEEYVQGIEKLTDAMRDEVYSVIMIADPIPHAQIDTVRHAYERLYTEMSPFAETEQSLGRTIGKTVTDSFSESISNALSDSVAFSQSDTYSESSSNSSSVSNTDSYDCYSSYSSSESFSNSSSVSTATSEGRTVTHGTSRAKTEQKGKSNAQSVNDTSNLQFKSENRTVKSLLGRINTQLDRFSQCSDVGMWSCCTYIIADDMQTSRTAASAYQALMRGENSGVEATALNSWSKYSGENYENVCKSLHNLAHPLFLISAELPVVNPSSLISSDELAIALGLPQKSIPGVSVSHYAAFGRQVQYHKQQTGALITLGNIFHMGITESSAAELSTERLSEHTFVTGATGSGKSNTVYSLLNGLIQKGIPFLVIEPAKGEYKHVFGARKDVNVFGTNTALTPLLKIDPFRFATGIDVSEHVERLIDIFNVCWPMYSAMPAVLKDAIECAYKAAGWDLSESVNRYTPPLYPTFDDVLSALKTVVEASSYSSEVKGNYIGALATRIKSLTNGINGKILVPDEIGDRLLFDGNTIIDLSRTPSAETKSLLMGILVMRLSEYRISSGGINRHLCHVTVLEEAHHLLRSSFGASSEGANILGRSVEMLSQAIAEMRTYGEGFIIADQSPGMLDMSAIRNTGTKIILRLPEFSDRELCGRAANLNNEQIAELAKLPTGVAAIYQNNWFEPILCKINHVDVDDCEYSYTAKRNHNADIRIEILHCLLGAQAGDTVKYSLSDMREKVARAKLSARCRIEVMNALECDKTLANVCMAVSMLFDTEKIMKVAAKEKSVSKYINSICSQLDEEISGLNDSYKQIIIQCLMKHKCASASEMLSAYNCFLKHTGRSEF